MSLSRSIASFCRSALASTLPRVDSSFINIASNRALHACECVRVSLSVITALHPANFSMGPCFFTSPLLTYSPRACTSGVGGGNWCCITLGAELTADSSFVNVGGRPLCYPGTGFSGSPMISSIICLLHISLGCFLLTEPVLNTPLLVPTRFSPLLRSYPSHTPSSNLSM